MPDPFLAYISQGQLYLQSEGVGSIVESPFGQSIRDRAIQIYNRNAWKTNGRGGQALIRTMKSNAACEPPELPIDITSVTGGSRPGEIFYTLETNEISGVFARNGDGVERRLFHTADYRLRHPDVHPSGSEVAISIYHANGAANLALLSADGSDLTEITDGESIDEGPRWMPGSKRRMVFQSAGLARTPRGRPSSHGPFSIQQIDLETGDMSSLAHDDHFDFLWPRVAPDGTLYYIRRPNESLPKKSESLDALGALKDVALLPFRFLLAIGLFMDMATGRKITSRLMRPGGPVKPSAPSTWHLMRHSPNAATPETIAQNVLAYGLSSDGSIIHTNGMDIYQLPAAGGSGNKLLTGVDIDRIAAF